ncbi:MAG TPA: Gfo/Idh/MocA family oxidoreductase [Bacteroidetes bacterium]|nr:Gfo/Idh/MocA family oxidoreductase [Bacteroidota bacterium]
MKKQESRRDFLKQVALLTGSTVLASQLSWLRGYAANPSEKIFRGDKIRIGMIGIGSRGYLLFLHLKDIPQAEIAAVCDIYPPHLERAIRMSDNKAKGFRDHRKMLDEMKDLDAVVIATPLHTHATITIDALQAGKQVFCEKSMAILPEDALKMVRTALETGNLLQIGHQRMFNPKYLHAFELLRAGQIGTVTQIRAYWHRNSSWRRSVPKGNVADFADPKMYPDMEHFINWRLYRDYSRGLMTELASHQMQVANYILGSYPVKIMGSGSINYWKDGREVFDNVNLVYTYPDGTQTIYDSLTSNKHYGLEEQIMGPKGTMELEAGLMWTETPPPAPGILQLINNIEHGLFDDLPLGGASWVPDTPVKDNGIPILNEKLEDDGTRLEMEGFVHAVQTGEKYRDLLKQGYYATIVALLGDEAMMTGKVITMPEELILKNF